VSHEAADDQILAAARGQVLGKFGPGEGIGQSLVDDRLAGVGVAPAICSIVIAMFVPFNYASVV
jgi:hypothetical protein